MKTWLYPDEYKDSVQAVDYDALLRKGVRGLILDIDNTLLPYYVQEPDEALLSFLEDRTRQGFRLFIVSNGREERVKSMSARLSLPYVFRAGKPGKRGFAEAMRRMELPGSAIAVIGDQIFTDVLGGRRMGMYTILVRPVSPKDEWVTAVKRPFEKIVLFFYRRRERRTSA